MIRCVFTVVALLALVVLPIKGDRKRCFCDLRYSREKLHHGASTNNLRMLTDLPNPSYRHWLSVGCKRVLRDCPKDCRKKAHEWMGGSKFNKQRGQLACEKVQMNAPPNKKIYVYATYDPSVCGGRMWQYLGPLCCWKVHFPGYIPIYFNNYMCKQSGPPTAGRALEYLAE